MTNSKQPLRAVVLAAGQGTRMKSGMAKVLHRVLGKTILDRVLDAVHAITMLAFEYCNHLPPTCHMEWLPL